MPENTSPFIRPFRISARVARRIALAATAIAVLTTGALVVQSSVAAHAESRSATQLHSESTGMHAEQLDVFARIVDTRVAEAQAAAKAAAEARAAWLASPAGAQETARTMAATQYGWGEDQFGCLVSLWTKESNWRVDAYNASSGATGIPQALPGEKMAIAGADWQTNPATQIAWGLGYIAAAYGTPCAAWEHSQWSNWY